MSPRGKLDASNAHVSVGALTIPRMVHSRTTRSLRPNSPEMNACRKRAPVVRRPAHALRRILFIWLSAAAGTMLPGRRCRWAWSKRSSGSSHTSPSGSRLLAVMARGSGEGGPGRVIGQRLARCRRSHIRRRYDARSASRSRRALFESLDGDVGKRIDQAHAFAANLNPESFMKRTAPDPVDAVIAVGQAHASRPLTADEVRRIRLSQTWPRPRAPVAPIRGRIGARRTCRYGDPCDVPARRETTGRGAPTR